MHARSTHTLLPATLDVGPVDTEVLDAVQVAGATCRSHWGHAVVAEGVEVCPCGVVPSASLGGGVEMAGLRSPPLLVKKSLTHANMRNTQVKGVTHMKGFAIPEPAKSGTRCFPESRTDLITHRHRVNKVTETTAGQ